MSNEQLFLLALEARKVKFRRWPLTAHLWVTEPYPVPDRVGWHSLGPFHKDGGQFCRTLISHIITFTKLHPQTPSQGC